MPIWRISASFIGDRSIWGTLAPASSSSGETTRAASGPSTGFVSSSGTASFPHAASNQFSFGHDAIGKRLLAVSCVVHVDRHSVLSRQVFEKSPWIGVGACGEINENVEIAVMTEVVVGERSEHDVPPPVLARVSRHLRQARAGRQSTALDLVQLSFAKRAHGYVRGSDGRHPIRRPDAKGHPSERGQAAHGFSVPPICPGGAPWQQHDASRERPSTISDGQIQGPSISSRSW